MQFTTVRSKEKDYDMYLKSEKLVHSNQEHEKNVSQLLVFSYFDKQVEKNCYFLIKKCSQLFLFPSYFKPELNTVAAIWREKKWIPAIWRPKNVVHNCQEQGKRL